MSDLQCPARFLLVCSPDASTVDGLGEARVAVVYADATREDLSLALGRALGVPTRELEREVGLEGVLAGQSDDLAVLEDLADLHRGETVVVVAAGQPTGRAEVAVDADGVRVQA